MLGVFEIWPIRIVAPGHVLRAGMHCLAWFKTLSAVSRQITRVFEGMVAVSHMLQVDQACGPAVMCYAFYDRRRAVDRKSDWPGFSDWSHKSGHIVGVRAPPWAFGARYGLWQA